MATITWSTMLYSDHVQTIAGKSDSGRAILPACFKDRLLLALDGLYHPIRVWTVSRRWKARPITSLDLRDGTWPDRGGPSCGPSLPCQKLCESGSPRASNPERKRHALHWYGRLLGSSGLLRTGTRLHAREYRDKTQWFPSLSHVPQRTGDGTARRNDVLQPRAFVGRQHEQAKDCWRERSLPHLSTCSRRSPFTGQAQERVLRAWASADAGEPDFERHVQDLPCEAPA